MADQRIRDMTLEELNELVEQIVDRRLKQRARPETARTVEEVLASLDRNLWTPPPGTKSSLELLREDHR